MISTRGYSIYSARVSSVSPESAPGIRLKCSTVVLDETNSFRDPDFFWWMRLKNFLFQVPIKLKNRNESLRFIFQEFFFTTKENQNPPTFSFNLFRPPGVPAISISSLSKSRQSERNRADTRQCLTSNTRQDSLSISFLRC